MSPLDATNASFIMGFIVFASQYGKGRNISISRLLSIRPITLHWRNGQSAYTLRFRMMSFVKIDTFQKGRA